MLLNRLWLSACVAVAAFSTHAQNLQCPDIAKTLKEYSIDSSSSSFLRSVFSEHCQADGSRKSSGGGVGLDLVIKAVPISFTGDYSTSEQAVSQFCKRYKDFNEGSSDADSYKETISRKALETIQQCVALQATGTVISHQINNVEAANFYMKSSVTSPLQLNGVAITGRVTCEGMVGNSKRTFDASLSLQVKATAGFACKRTGTPGPNNVTNYDEATITVLTSQGNYSLFWPKDERQSESMATVIDRRIRTLEGDVSVAKGNLAPLVAATSSPVYKCPNGTQGVSYNAKWTYVGCNGQYSTEATCTNAWYGWPAQVLQCTPAGSIRLFK